MVLVLHIFYTGGQVNYVATLQKSQNDKSQNDKESVHLSEQDLRRRFELHSCINALHLRIVQEYVNLHVNKSTTKGVPQREQNSLRAEQSENKL